MATHAQALNAKLPAREMLKSIGASVITVGARYDDQTGEWRVRAVVADEISEHIKEQILHLDVPIEVISAEKWYRSERR